MNRNKISFFLLLLWASLATALAQPNPYMVADIDMGLDYSLGSNPDNLTVVGTKLYFTINSGTALGVSDGTAAGTARVMGIPSDMNNIRYLTDVNGTLYFSANTSANGTELYKYNGTTLTLIDINVGAGSSFPGILTNVNGTLYFSADNGTNGMELYKYNGTSHTLIDINASGSSFPGYLTNVNGTLYFSANGGTNGTELYKYNGTNYTLIDINVGLGESSPQSLTNVNGTLYFSADDGNNGRELYKYDGTNFTLIDIAQGLPPFGSSDSYPTDLTNVNGILYFSADDGNNGRELYKYDGTNFTLIDIAQGWVSSFPSHLTNVNGTLYFSAALSQDASLYKCNNTTFTWIGDFASVGNNSSLDNLTNVNGILHFTAYTANNGFELYQYDGTTVTSKDINSGSGDSSPSSLTNFNGTLYFSADNGTNGRELLKSNSTLTSVQMVKDLGSAPLPTFATNSSPHFIEINGTLYFTNTTPTNGKELYKYDGTTLTFIDINVGAGSSNPKNFTNINGTLYFQADNGTNGSELYKYNGTTLTLIDVNTGAGGSYPEELTNINGTLYFTADGGTNGRELYKYTGGVAAILIDIYLGINSSNASDLINANGTLYFTADNGTNGKELYKYDGTNYTLIDINPTNSSNPSDLTNINSTLYFQADNGTNGSEFCIYDGTTLTLVDINVGTGGSYPSDFTNVNGTLYFSAYASASGQELYKYTGGTTVALIDVFSGIYDPCSGSGDPPCYEPISSSPYNLTNINGTLYFQADNGQNSQLLYKYLGYGNNLTQIINSGFTNVVDFMGINNDVYLTVSSNSYPYTYLYLYNGASYTQVSYGTNPKSLTNVNGTLYFTVSDGTNGTELWKIDGAGTHIVKDIWSGSNSSNPSNLFDSGNKLYFTATYNPTGDKYGTELWTLGNCTPTNTAVTAAGQSETYNSETQVSPTTQSCHCDVFNKLVATIDATGANPVTGTINSKEWIDATTIANYVKRHYEINPATNPTTATGKVTLYFAQAEFDAFNALNTTDLPANSSDVAGKANLRIKKYNGTSSDGSGAENTYTGSATTIDPVDSDIIWNATASRWEVSFQTTGFGGFFVSTGITTGQLSTNLASPPSFYCAGSIATVAYTSTDLTFATGNTFILQLSNASGSFSNPVVLKTISSTTTSGTISANLPATTTAGVGYKLRVVSSNAAFTGFPTTAFEIKVSTAAAATISHTGGITANQAAITLNPQTNLLITGCQGANVVLTANNTGGNPYQWWKNGVNIASAANQPTLNVDISWGDYQLVVLDANGCGSGSDTVGINLKPLPVANAGTDRNICQGTTTTIGTTAQANTTYTWTPSTHLSSASVANPTVLATLPTTTTYSLQITKSYTVLDANFTCSSANDDVLVTLKPQPAAPSITASATVVCQGTNISVTASNAAGTIKWYADNALISGANPLTVNNTAGITKAYTAKNLDANGCYSVPSNAISLIVQNAPTPTITSSVGTDVSNVIKVCPGITNAILTANATSGTPVFTWFNPPNANVISTGNTLALSNVSTTSKSYYVKATYTYPNLSCVKQSVTKAIKQDATATGCRFMNDGTESAESAMVVYPNPTSNLLNVKVQVTQAGDATLNLVNSLGQQVWSEQRTFNEGMTELQLSLEHLPAGFYHLTLENGDMIQTVKVVKD